MHAMSFQSSNQARSLSRYKSRGEETFFDLGRLQKDPHQVMNDGSKCSKLFCWIPLQFTAVFNQDLSIEDLSILSLSLLGNSMDEIHRFLAGYFTKDDVLAVEVAEWNGGNEELGAVGVLSGVGHREQTWFGVLVVEILVCELFTIDGFTAGSVSLGEVTTLKHEIVNHAVEMRSRVTESFLSGAKSSEVLDSAWDILVEFKFNAAPVLGTAGRRLPFDIEVCLDHFVESWRS